ncbi:MAG TPA: GcrA family cell cycle regulator [Candidatus Acidoferrales bacterium]|nr:GcrA family cell cycle regulator [Candidatus Acidoferrales bacterium]
MIVDEIAAEHCLWCASQGMTPRQVIASIAPGSEWNGYDTDWPDVRRFVANAWLQLDKQRGEMTQSFWTEEQLDRLRILRESGLSGTKIMPYFGKSRGTIMRGIRKLSALLPSMPCQRCLMRPAIPGHEECDKCQEFLERGSKWDTDAIIAKVREMNYAAAAREMSIELGCKVTKNQLIGAVYRERLRAASENDEVTPLGALPPLPRLSSCTWINGDPKKPGWSWCGEPAQPGTSWCPDHRKIVYVRPTPPSDARMPPGASTEAA